MASRKEQRERARQERERQEANEQARQRRQRRVQLGTAAVLLAIVAVVAVIIVSQQGGGSSGRSTDVKDVSQVDSELHGLDQQGLTLGDPKAKVTVVEFGDLQCPVCKAYSEQIMPAVIAGPVQSGDAKLEFRNWTIIGPQSKPAAEAALAASEQGRYWSFITLFYRNQGEENSGYVTDAFLEAIAKGAGVPDISKLDQDRQSSKWDSQLAQNDTEATQLGLTGTPGFLFEGPNGKRKTVASPGSAAAIESAIKAVS
jgi:protein-disulfide isomerase